MKAVAQSSIKYGSILPSWKGKVAPRRGGERKVDMVLLVEGKEEKAVAS